MKYQGKSFYLLLLYWLLLLVASLFLRPLFPVDETRYASVAWEMWLHGDYLVPHLNGAPYAHKPPLLFWLINLGWWLFGVNDIWPRLIAPLFSLGSLYLTYQLARRLWPEQPQIAYHAPWFVFATFLWLVFYTMLQFDMLLLFFTLLGILAIWNAHQQQSAGWWLLTLAIGLGALSKGPVILLHVLPVALLAPWWTTEKTIPWRRWYLYLMLSILGGTAIGLAWAIPAAISGGEEYRNAIFWGQTANRVVHSFAHRQPWWWYLPMLPVLLLPWPLWARVWRALPQLKGCHTEVPMRFLASWIVPVFILFSLVSAKQIKYLLPLLPAFALLIACLVNRQQDEVQPGGSQLPQRLLLVGGVILALLPYIAPTDKAWWIQEISPFWGMLLIALAAIILIGKKSLPGHDVEKIGTATVLAMLVTHFALLSAATPSYDLREFSQTIKNLQDQGHDIAYVGNYRGQFEYLGRLSKSVTQLSRLTVGNWIEAHPDGFLVIHDSKQRYSGSTVFVQPYREKRDALKLLSATDYLHTTRGNTPD